MGQASSKKKTKPLNMREAKYVKAKAQGLSNTKAAMIATGTKSVDSAKRMGHEISTKLNVQEAIVAEFERQGLTMERIIAPINRALEAKKTVIHGDGDDAFADVIDDYSIQLKASGMAAQFLGFNKTEGSVTNINLIGLSNNDKNAFNLS